LPNDNSNTGSGHISVRVPSDVVAALDRIAAALERPRSWVIVRALRQYIEDGEGAEIEEDTESLAELDRGEIVTAEEAHRRIRRIIDASEETGRSEKE